MFARKSAELKEMATLYNQFKGFDVVKRRNAETDFSRSHKGCSTFFEISPKTIQEVAEIMSIASDHRIPLRIRGNRYSMNGFSLPKKNEVLFRSDHFNDVQILPSNIAVVGGGTLLPDLQNKLRDAGFGLGVFPGGGGTPTIAGYISSGGIGINSDILGGFWDTVLEITLITPSGQILNIQREDPLFMWLFGSMGQFGFIAEVKIKIYPLSKFDQQVRFLNPDFVSLSKEEDVSQYWYTIFTPIEREKKALDELTRFKNTVEDSWEFISYYRYFVAFKSFNPPLLFPFPEPFAAIGIAGCCKNYQMPDSRTIFWMDQIFHELILSDKKYRRYIQCEFVPDNMDYRQYFGDETITQFMKLKRRVDPHFILNGHALIGKTATKASDISPGIHK